MTHETCRLQIRSTKKLTRSTKIDRWSTNGQQKLICNLNFWQNAPFYTEIKICETQPFSNQFEKFISQKSNVAFRTLHFAKSEKRQNAKREGSKISKKKSQHTTTPFVACPIKKKKKKKRNFARNAAWRMWR